MQTLPGVNAEQLARLFHHYKEAFAHDCAPERNGNSITWDRTPQGERKLMVAAARFTLLELSTTPEPRTPGSQILPPTWRSGLMMVSDRPAAVLSGSLSTAHLDELLRVPNRLGTLLS